MTAPTTLYQLRRNWYSVVGAVVEQVYNSTFKFRLLQNTKNMSPEMFYFTSKCTKNAFGGRAAPWPADSSVQRCPDPLAELKGRGGERAASGKREGGGREGEMEEEVKGRRKGEDPQCMKWSALTVLTPMPICQLEAIINVLALSRSMHRSVRTSKIDKNGKYTVLCLYPTYHSIIKCQLLNWSLKGWNWQRLNF